jgi:hypothetical protein
MERAGVLRGHVSPEARMICIYMHTRTCTHAHTHFSVFIGCCDEDVGRNGREPTTGLVILIFLASRTHAHHVCVCMCQYNVYGVVTVCMQCLGFAVKDRCVFLLFVCGGRWHCRNCDFIGLYVLAVVN